MLFFIHNLAFSLNLKQGGREMGMQGLCSFRTKKGISKIVVGCNGFDVPMKVICSLVDGSLDTESASIFGERAMLGCKNCRREFRLSPREDRFIFPGNGFTVAETITVDFVGRKIEVSSGAAVVGRIWDCKGSLKPLGRKLESFGWQIFKVCIPFKSFGPAAETSDIGACW